MMKKGLEWMYRETAEQRAIAQKSSAWSGYLFHQENLKV